MKIRLPNINSWITLSLIMAPFFFFAQNKYVFEYDKLTDEITYYKSLLKEGKTELIEIKKPKIGDGDLYTIKAVNINELVFDMEILESLVYEPQENVIGNIIQGVQPLLGGLGGKLGSIINQLSDMSFYRPNPIVNNRGGVMTEEEIKLESYMDKYSQTIDEVEFITKKLKEIRDIESEIIFSESKTLEQIKNEFDAFSKEFSLDELNKHLDHALELVEELRMEMGIIEALDLGLANRISESDKKIQKISQSFFNDEFLGNSHMLQKYRAELNKIDFEISETYVSGLETITEEEVEETTWEWKSSSSNEIVQSTEYLLLFSYLNDTSETNFNGTQFTKKMKFSHKGVNLPKWTTGLIVVSPFQQLNEYNVIENGLWGDSLKVQSNPLDKNLFSLGTFLSYEFYNRTNLIPSVNAGAGLGFLDQNQGKISFNFGAGLKFAKIPFLSITGGMSWLQSKQIKSSFSKDVWFEAPADFLDEYDNLDPFTYESKLFETKFKPGYFIGITLNL